MATVAPGDVIRLFMQTTKPPKFKYCVVACIEPSPILLLINSRINEFVIKNTELNAAQVLIDSAAHQFLCYDSWIDCTQLFGYPLEFIHAALEADPRERLGHISIAVRRDIISSVETSRLLSPKKKALILDGLMPPDADGT